MYKRGEIVRGKSYLCARERLFISYICFMVIERRVVGYRNICGRFFFSYGCNAGMKLKLCFKSSKFDVQLAAGI